MGTFKFETTHTVVELQLALTHCTPVPALPDSYTITLSHTSAASEPWILAPGEAAPHTSLTHEKMAHTKPKLHTKHTQKDAHTQVEREVHLARVVAPGRVCKLETLLVL